MNEITATKIFWLSHQPQWKAFVELKEQRLEELRKQLEVARPEAVADLQGRISEVRRDLDLQARCVDLLNK